MELYARTFRKGDLNSFETLINRFGQTRAKIIKKTFARMCRLSRRLFLYF